MQRYKAHTSHPLLVALAVLALSACGGNNNNNSPAVADAPAPDPEPTSVQLRGPIDQVLPASVLDTGALAARALPSEVLDTRNFSSEESTTGTEVTLITDLSADQEVLLGGASFDSDANPGAAATGDITVDTSTGEVSGEVVYSGFTDAVTMVHIHDGFAGSNGPVIVGLEASGSDRFVVPAGTILDSGQLGAFNNGRLYLNLHTPSNPGGELRGQLVPGNVLVLTSTLAGEQENPPVETEATGRGYLTVNTDTGNVWANVIAEGLTATMAHIHSGTAGVNGPVIIGLEDISEDVGNATGTVWTSPVPSFAQSVAGLSSGNYYFNVHTEANPSGELRGQLAAPEVQVLRAEVESNQEVPPVASTATGVGYLTVNTDTSAVSARVNLEGLSAIMAHIHQGFAGANGPVIIGLEDVSEADAPGTAWAAPDGSTAQSVTGLFNGNYYFNIHSEANPSGELRGQLVGPDTSALRTELEGRQENPAVETDSGGVGYLTFNAVTDQIWANVRNTGFEATMAHIHSGSAGTNGPVIIGLEDISATVDGAAPGSVWTSPAGSVAQSVGGINAGNYYFNVHSAANPSGEVRGQLVGNNWQVLRTELEGSQEVPAVTSDAGGVGYLTVGELSGAVRATVNLQGFSATMAHIHQGWAGANGPVIIGLEDTSADSGAETGTVWSTPAGSTAQSVTGLLRGAYYFNAHSAANPSGEVRGQLTGSASTVFRSELETRQVVATAPAAEGDGSGTVGYLTFVDEAVPALAVRVRTDFVADGGSVLRGSFAGIEGAPQILLEDLDSADPGRSFGAGLGTEAPAEVASADGLFAGAYAFEMSSGTNPDGAVRGQLAGPDVVAIRSDITGDNALPDPVSTDATAVGYVTLDRAAGEFRSNVRVADLDEIDAVTITRATETETLFSLEQSAEDPNLFTSNPQPPVNQDGLENGAYAFQVTGTETP